MTSKASHKFYELTRRPLQFRMYLLRQLPAAYFSGVRLVKMDQESCSVKVPYKWFTRNPFRSTYFACLSMAAEMSTGLLAMANIYGRTPGVSMLVTGIEASFQKKATGRSIFICKDGAAIASAIEQAIATNQPQSFTATAIGYNEQNEVVAIFKINWSFKARAGKV